MGPKDSDRRTAIADAAVGTLAAHGMRGFTHRAVDRAAGLAEGSTSYYFRTRTALLYAVLARIAELDGADVAGLPPLGPGLGVAEAGELSFGLMRYWLTESRDRTLARLELTLEATRQPELRARMAEVGAGFRQLVIDRLAAIGADRPELWGDLLVSLFDGLVIHQVSRVGASPLSDAELRAVCTAMSRMAMSGDSPQR